MALAAVLGLTAYVALTGSHDDVPVGDRASSTASPQAAPSSGAQVSPAPGPPVSTYSLPPTWVDPVRWAVLPRGTKTTAGGLQTGFPGTVEGAVAVLVTATATNLQAGATSLVEQQLASYNTYLSSADQSPAAEAKVRATAAQMEAQSRSDLGLPASGALPEGVFLHGNVVGYRVIQSSPSEVTVYLLTKVSQKRETTPVTDNYVVSVLGTVWQGDDWKMSVKASSDAVAQTRGKPSPPIAAPGDVAFNEAGWTAIRQAS